MILWQYRVIYQPRLSDLEIELNRYNQARSAHPSLQGYAPKPDYRPLTKFENRGLKLGHGVWDVVCLRR